MTAQTVSTIGDPIMPADNNPSGDPNQVVWMGEGSTTPPAKTLTLINNSDHTIYPFLASANNAAQNGQGSIYDPKDSWNQDYRGYIGYTGQDGKNYLGLPAGQTITIPVPLVFWDAGRIYIASDSAYLTTDAKYLQPNPPINPYQYYQFNQDSSETLRLHQQSGNLTPSGLAGVVMWYHGHEALGPNNDAPAQLLEFTIRDPWQLNLNSKLDKNTLGPLINYDVSYVDTIYLPVAMEATDATDGSKTAAFGWIGASQTQSQFQNAFKTFTAADSSNGLGQYFGGKGYTQYNLPSNIEPAAGIKLPSGAQAIGDSPLQNKRSSYDSSNNQYLLTSGGTGGIEVDISAVPAKEGSTILPITFNSGPSGAEQQAVLQNGVTQPGTMNVSCDQANVIPAKTKLVSYQVNGDTGTITLSNATDPNPNNTSYVVHFKRPIADYVTSALLNLWYSWAQYYIDHSQTGNQTYSGSLTSDRVLTFTNPVPAKTLVPGMQVSGKGIPSGSGSFCTIAAITPNDGTPIQSVTLSELVTVSSTNSYQFTAPQPIGGIDDELNGNKIVQPFPLTFGTDTATAILFSQAVYQAMSAMSAIPQDTQNQVPFSVQLLYNIIGCNVGQIPHIGQDLDPRDNRIGGEITDKIKSALRGVPDFWTYPEAQWYPEPSIATGNCKFNVYNLDPFVWFVHQQLGLSGYGFSVDDDVADVGANGATNLAIAIGGLNGLPNPKKWSPENPYGS